LVLWPLAAYFGAVLLQTVALVPRGGWLVVPALPLIVMTHLLYGLGFWRGLFTTPGKGTGQAGVDVALERVAS
jgi:hypothetical protein